MDTKAATGLTASNSPSAGAEFERRGFPRIAVDLPIEVSGGIGRVVNVSETGLGFVVPRGTPTGSFAADFRLDAETISARVEPLWEQPHAHDTSIRGGRFISVKGIEGPQLRRLLFSIQIEPLLKGIESSEARKDVESFFLEDVQNYFSEMQELIGKLDAGKVALDLATSELTRLTDEVLGRGSALEARLGAKKLADSVKVHFRHLTSPWAYKGTVVKRALEKPRGYPGDYLLLESIYDNSSLSRGIGIASDRYFLNNSYSAAVRNRLVKVKGFLKEFIANGRSGEPFRVLNIACGSVREIRELLDEGGDFFGRTKVHITCFDHDKEALGYSEKKLDGGIRNLSLEFVHGDVLNFLKENSFPAGYDLIYSVGLADYLPDRLLKRLLIAWAHLLKPGGRLLITHKDLERSKPLAPEWFCDWGFYARTEEEMVDTFNSLQLSGFRLKMGKVEREDSQQIMFFVLQKDP